MLTVGSLFSGAGLCDLGLSWAGLKHQWFCEIDPFCRAVLARHWPSTPIYNDIACLDGVKLPSVDVLVGGFPCQDVSGAGKRAGVKIGTRSGLWYEYARIIKEVQPQYVIIENVRGLLSCGIEIVMQGLAQIGYDAEWEVLPAAALGAPHHRERVFVVAYPVGTRPDRTCRLLHPLKGIVGDHEQFAALYSWLGLRFDRACKTSPLEGYRAPILYRVDDGRATGLDDTVRPFSGREYKIGCVNLSTARAWIPRLKALGNAITPQQSYAIAACILHAEGLPVPPLPR
ncbi:MAG: DNA cytosine methyltransferase [Desulfovibrio sp.]|nr:DNA cytosine methyltransferase [Desulfovibrio sp.]